MASPGASICPLIDLLRTSSNMLPTCGLEAKCPHQCPIQVCLIEKLISEADETHVSCKLMLVGFLQLALPATLSKQELRQGWLLSAAARSLGIERDRLTGRVWKGPCLGANLDQTRSLSILISLTFSHLQRRGHQCLNTCNGKIAWMSQLGVSVWQMRRLAIPALELYSGIGGFVLGKGYDQGFLSSWNHIQTPRKEPSGGRRHLCLTERPLNLTWKQKTFNNVLK